jgi:cytochrome P450
MNGNLEQMIPYGDSADLTSFRIANKTFLLISSHELIKSLYSLDQKQIIKPAKAQKYTKEALGTGIISTDKSQWLHERSLVKGIFNKNEIADGVKSIPEIVCEKIQSLGENLDAQAFFSSVSIEIMGRQFFGHLSAHDQKEIIDGIGDLLEPTLKKMASPLPFLVDPFNRICKSARERVFKVMEANIAKARLASTPNLTQKYFPHGNSVESMTNIFVAGYETTATTLTWLFFELGRNKEVLDRVKAELDLVNEDAELISQIPFCKACLDETLRLYPAVWMMSRTPVDNIQVNELIIKAKTDILLSPYLFHRLNKYWDSPNKFDPDRFFKPPPEKVDKPYFFPFGKGVRSCIGENLAKAEIYTVLAYLLKNFSLEVETNKAYPMPYFTLVPDRPIQLKIKKRTP